MAGRTSYRYLGRKYKVDHILTRTMKIKYPQFKNVRPINLLNKLILPSPIHLPVHGQWWS